MPQKLPAASRPPQARSWGTRFDGLATSPPSSPLPDIASGHGYRSETRSHVSPTSASKEGKMPHDASVFVGSLPIHVDHNELAQLLSEHLSVHAEVLSVKVVQDAKGGVCAFVQCEDAATAEALIKTLHSVEPRPFLGRTLRFERARAFRTLLISYRRPTQYMFSNDITTADHPAAGHQVDLDLPTAMRVFRTKNTRSFNVVYNAEAKALPTTGPTTGGQDSALGLYMSPLAFDEDTIHMVSTFFGPLESFSRYQVPGEHAYAPYPHDAPRDSVMDNAVFEVKWSHRDDCVSALKTLRRVPHLTVTWAHQPPLSQKSYSHVFEPYPLYIQQANASENNGHATVSMHSNNTHTSRHIHSPSTPSSKSWTEAEFPGLGNQNERDRLDWFEDEFVDTQRRTPVSEQGQTSVSSERSFASRLITAPRDPNAYHEDSILSQTPTSARSPITPWTPGSVFPPTPTMTSGFPSRSDLSSYGADSAEKIIDPKSLFIGGLEMHGPHIWDESSIQQMFGKYGGLQSIKLVRPLQGRTAFAFVKFDNEESPVRAVQGENNKLYGGRPIRVQLREHNPVRSGASRLREKLNQSARHSMSPPAFSPGHHHDDRSGIPGYVYHPDSGISTSVSSQSAIHVQQHLPSSLSHTAKSPASAFPQSGSGSVHVLQDSFKPNRPGTQNTDVAEKYREWYEIEAEPGASQPVSHNVAPQSLQHNAQGYYGPMPPWMSASVYGGPQPPFSAPYMVPQYPLPAQVPPRGYSPGEGEVPASAQVWQHPPNVYGYMPYAFGYPAMPNEPPMNHPHPAQFATAATLVHPEQTSARNSSSGDEEPGRRASPVPVAPSMVPPWVFNTVGPYRSGVPPGAGATGWFPGNVAQPNTGFMPTGPHPQQLPTMGTMPMPGLPPGFLPQNGPENGSGRPRLARGGPGHRGRGPHSNGRQQNRRGQQSHGNHMEQQMRQSPPGGWNHHWVATTVNTN